MMIFKNSINERRIWVPIAVAVPIALASWSTSSAAYDAGSMQNQSRSGAVATSGSAADSLASGGRLMLRESWQVQTSGGQPDGAAISKAGFAASGWFPTAVPATVSGVLAQAHVYPDPFFGTNFRDWPGMGRGGSGAAGFGAPQNNPFSVGWWFRTEFDLPAQMAGRSLTLHFEGINYRADVWLNGERIADNSQVAGAMRRFAFDVTKAARPGQRNALALLIRGQGPRDLGHTWVDWAPMPPDRMQGLWRDVFITAGGALRIHDPFVRSRIAANLDSADLIVSMDLENTSDKPVTGAVAVIFNGATTTIPVSVAVGVTQRVTLDGAGHPGLHVAKPRLWWPIGYGNPDMYSFHPSPFHCASRGTDYRPRPRHHQ